MNRDSFIIDNFVWSFSRINSFENCPYGWNLHYIEDQPFDRDNAYAQFGGYIHKILEKVYKGELNYLEAPQYYIDHYGEYVTEGFPKEGMDETYYNTGLEYFENFIELDKKYEILGVELEEKFKVNDYNMIGYIDLLLQDKNDDAIIILDHKSAALKRLKKGGIAKKDRWHFESFKRQLYLYSIPVLKEYGHVDFLKWNLFRTQDEIVVPWKESEFIEAKEWAVNTIQSIYNTEDYSHACRPGEFNYFGNNLCEYYFSCPYSYINTKQSHPDYSDEYDQADFGDTTPYM